MSWWGTKTRQAYRHLLGRVSAAERAELCARLDGPQWALFASMHRADQRHGLDVMTTLQGEGFDDPELMLAALLHDCSKGPDTRLWHRVAWSLGERYGDRVLMIAARAPGFDAAFERLRHHADDSARLAREAGCSERTADLIRHQADPREPRVGAALRAADEAC